MYIEELKCRLLSEPDKNRDCIEVIGLFDFKF